MGYSQDRAAGNTGCVIYMLYSTLMDKIIKGALLIVFSFFVIMIITGLFGACNPSKKAQRELEKAKQVLGNNYGEAAKFCAEKFPDKTEYIKGDSVVLFDTLYVGGDVVFDTVETKDTVYITQTLPGKVITKTVRITDTIKIEDRAKLVAANVMLNEQIGYNAVLKNENTELKKNLSDWKAKAKKRWNLWFVIVALVAWNFRKHILKLIKLV